MQDQEDLCRVCETARATGEDGLCDGCRGARTLARVEKQTATGD
jgi:hypothetical protein